MTDAQIRLIVRSELTRILSGLIATEPPGPSSGIPVEAALEVVLAGLPPGVELTATQIRERVPEPRPSPTRTGQLLAERVGRVAAGRVLRRRRSPGGCSLYRIEPVGP